MKKDNIDLFSDLIEKRKGREKRIIRRRKTHFTNNRRRPTPIGTRKPKNPILHFLTDNGDFATLGFE